MKSREVVVLQRTQKKSCDHVGPLSFLIATNFVSDDVAKFRTRGVLLLKAGRESSISVSQNQLSEEDRAKLKVSLPESEDTTGEDGGADAAPV